MVCPTPSTPETTQWPRGVPAFHPQAPEPLERRMEQLEQRVRFETQAAAPPPREARRPSTQEPTTLLAVANPGVLHNRTRTRGRVLA